MLKRSSLWIFIIATAAAAAPEQQLLGAEKCTWGPSFWCSGLRQAAKCSATQHCITEVWETNEVPEDDDQVCTICKEMVAEARDTLLSNQTQEELKEVMDGSCKLIPLKIIVEECKKLAEEFVVELTETLASEMNPTMVCTTAGLCNSVRIDRLLADFHERRHQRPRLPSAPPRSAAAAADCGLCRAETARLVGVVRRAQPEAILDKSLEICGHLSSYSDACKATVVENFASIYAFLTRDVDASLCDLVGVCHSALEAPDEALAAAAAAAAAAIDGQQGDIQCEFCEKVIQHWKDAWISNTTEEEFKQVLEAICRRMGGKHTDHCLHIVDDYYIPAFNFVLHEVDPHMVCSLIGLCGAGQFLQVDGRASIATLLATTPSRDEVIQMLPLQPAIRVTGMEESIRTNTIQQSPQRPHPQSKQQAVGLLQDGHTLIGGYFNKPAPQPVSSNPTCVLCEFVLHKLQEWLVSNRTEAQVKMGLDKVCGIIPRHLKAECDWLVDMYGPAIFELLVRGFEPRSVCAAMQLCGSAALAALPEHAPARPDWVAAADDAVTVEEESFNSNTGCAMCEYGVNTLKEIIEDKQNEAEITHALESLCTYLPSTIAKECTTFVETYTEQLIDMLMQDMSADEICEELGLCQRRRTVEGGACVICEYMVDYLKEMVGNKDNEAEIKDEMVRLCNYVPSRIEQECTILVEKYADQVINLLMQDLNAEEICTVLGLCQSQTRTFVAAAAVKSDVGCEMCKYGVNQLKEMLKDKTTEAEIKEALGELCDYLPSSMEEQCHVLIETYTDALIDMLVQDLSADEICTEIGLCQTTALVETMTKADESCVLCEYVVQTLDGLLEDQNDVDEIKNTLDALCGYLPKTVTKQCVQFVNTYTDMVIQLLVKGVTPKELCTVLGLCDGSFLVQEESRVAGDVSALLLAADAEQADERRRDQAPYCTLCEYAISEVHRMLAEHKNEGQIKQVLDTICYELSAAVRQECLRLVNANTDKIIDMFVNGYTAEEVCLGLGLCVPSDNSVIAAAAAGHITSNAIPPLPQEKQELTIVSVSSAGKPLCVLCEFALTALEKKILTNSTFDMIERAVQMLCSYLPATIAEECEKFVDENGEKIIDLIVEEELDPKEVCTGLELCDEATQWDASVLGGHKCNWGPSYWCVSRFHARMCGTTRHCRDNVWNN